jgi:sugar/nucleoside kinase (ribokinase family)
MGERGLMTYREAGPHPRSFFTVDTFVNRVVDAVGAGDALLAYATASLVVTRCPVIASILGAFAAALACEREGNHPIDPKDVIEKMNQVEKRIKYE